MYGRKIAVPMKIKKAFVSAFPYTIPIFAGFWFLGITYGVYMNVSGFGFWYPQISGKGSDVIMWLLYAVGSSFFAGITSIFAKCGIKKTDSDVATAIRTIVVLLFSWLMVLITGTGGQITQISGKTFLFLVLSGLATGASWLCYYRALQTGQASVVVPIDKLSILVTIAFSWIVFREKLSGKAVLGLIGILAGTLWLALL